MKLSPQLRMNIIQVLVITIANVVINVFITLFVEAVILSIPSHNVTHAIELNVRLPISIGVGIFAGLLSGSTLVFVNTHLFSRKSFGYAMMTTAGVYLLTFTIIILFISGISSTAELGFNADIGRRIDYILHFISHPNVLMYFLLWGAITLFTLFMLQVNDKFGPGMLLKFLSGKYHHPTEEDRVFMFLDMRSSTTIAEKIGNKQYFSLLKDLYSDLAFIVINNRGEIYQYVGDEIVLCWPIEKGIKSANCLQCFLQIQQKLKQRAPDYQAKYGVAPEMKAGVHSGIVTVGEIGSIKKDIVYSGDVLNTAARIQAQCNHYKVNFLISKLTADLISAQNDVAFKELGSIELRGKEEIVQINTLAID